MLPVLWIFAFQGYSLAVAVGIIIAALTDTLDGVLARRLGQVSEFGSKLDSLADNLLKPSVLIWLLILVPELLENHSTELLVAGVAYAATITIGLFKFKRFGNLHLYSGKVGSIVQYLFIFHALVFPGYDRLLFYLAVGMFILSNAEAILIMLTRSQVDEHIGSILAAWLSRS
ncbi:MAG: CDP-alcohol phosphatidyltransferase family protein [Anaerolineales bacterium]|nr:CDP-alcohol phosphatidyltransferase family protein [Anaerolineales bacterium]